MLISLAKPRLAGVLVTVWGGFSMALVGILRSVGRAQRKRPSQLLLTRSCSFSLAQNHWPSVSYRW